MPRFIRELFHPEERCARVGHKEGVRVREGYVRPESYRHICDGVVQVQSACRRCGEPLGAWKQEGLRQGFTSFSWPSDMAREFEEKGSVWPRSWWR